IQDLAHKKVAGTPGTDGGMFVLRALELNGMHKSDIEFVPLAHVLGRKALEEGKVDAWGALDPHQSASVLENGTRIIYRNPELCPYAFQTVTESYPEPTPDIIKRVPKVSERARLGALATREELVKVLADEAKVSPAVAKMQLQRYDFSNPVPGAEHVKSL